MIKAITFKHLVQHYLTYTAFTQRNLSTIEKKIL